MRNWTVTEIDTIAQSREDGVTWDKIGEEHGASADQVRSVYRKRQGASGREGEYRRFQSGAMDALKFSSKPVRTEADALEFFGLDPGEWACDSFESSVYQTPMKLKDTEGNEQAVRKNLFRIKGKFTPKKEVTTARSEIRELVDTAKRELKKFPKAVKLPKRNKSNKSTRMGLVSIADLHIDKLAVGDITLGEDQSFERQRAIAERTIMGIAAKLARDPIDKIWFPVGHDLFNDDYRAKKVPSTTAGTPQQSELDWQKTYRETRIFLCRMVTEVLGQIAPVFIPVIPGNHDTAKCFFLGDALEVWSANQKHITVDNSQGLRRYYEWGNCLFGMTHTIKYSQANAIMSQEAAALWKPRQYREWLVGHLHQARNTSLHVRPTDVERQVDGLYVRTLPSLSEADEWHSMMGFMGSVASGLGLAYNSQTGLDGCFPWTEAFDSP